MVNTEIRLIIFFAAKDGEAITAVMKLKECLLLGRKADKPRQHIKKQRHYFVDKGPSSQGYGFSSSHVWMWELDHKGSWVLKNRCFLTVVLKKTLESPLDCREIKSVNPKGNQSWIFIRRTDAEDEAPILWPPDPKNWLTRKHPDAEKDWRQEEKGTTEDETVGWHHQLYGHEFEQAPEFGDGQGSLACCSPWGCKEEDTTEWLNWTDFFALITEEGFLIISLLFLGTLHSDGYIFPFLLCLSLVYSQLFVRPPQTTILPFCIPFSWGWFWSPPPVKC